jgi:putative ABC transport system permease protein
MESFIQDARYAVRALRRRPAVTGLAVLCLGIGIGASTAIFSPVDVFMFRPFPYPDPGRLVVPYLNMPERGWTELNYSVGDFRDHREMARTLDIAAYDGYGYNLSGGDLPERLSGQQVSHNFFRVVGVLPALGRAFLPEDERPGAPGVTILGHDMWLTRFGGRDVLGTTIRLDGKPHTIVGIMPERFYFPEPDAELYTPLTISEASPRGSYYLGQVARLAPGATMETATEELKAVASRLAETYPEQNRGVGAEITSLWDDIFGREFRDGSAICSVAVMLLLLIASANVTNLLLARAADRGREIAVRTALGAGRRRIMTQLLTESVVLGLLGGVIGMGLGWAGIKGLVSLFPAGTPRADEMGMDLRVVAFGLVVTLIAGIISGLAPALQTSRQDLRETLQEGGRGAAISRHGGRIRNAFVTAEVAFALVLLVAAGLLVKGFVRMKGAETGLDGASVLTFRTTPAETRYPEREDLRRAGRDLVDRLAAVPGVQAVGLTSILPFSGNSSTSYGLAGEDTTGRRTNTSSFRSVSPGYFEAVGIELLQGRRFSAADDSGAPLVAIVNQALVRRHWPGSDAIGKGILLASGQREIVGIVEDTREFDLESPSPYPMIYLPVGQSPFRFMGVALRTAGDPNAVTAAARAAVLAMDPDQPIYDVLQLDRRLDLDIQGEGILAQIMIVLAAVALVLSLVGVYGVMAYSVSQRTQEIGVRMALGANREAVVGLVVRQGAKLAAIGCSVGLLMALGVSRGLSVFLFGVSAFDPATFGGGLLALATAAIMASYLPARRAARVDPMAALRTE